MLDSPHTTHAHHLATHYFITTMDINSPVFTLICQSCQRVNAYTLLCSSLSLSLRTVFLLLVFFNQYLDWFNSFNGKWVFIFRRILFSLRYQLPLIFFFPLSASSVPRALSLFLSLDRLNFFHDIILPQSTTNLFSETD